MYSFTHEFDLNLHIVNIFHAAHVETRLFVIVLKR